MVAPLLAICAAAEELEARRRRNWRIPSVGGCAGLGGWPPIRGRTVWNAVCTRRLMLTVDANPSRDRSVVDRALITVASPLRHHRHYPGWGLPPRLPALSRRVSTSRWVCPFRRQAAHWQQQATFGGGSRKRVWVMVRRAGACWLRGLGGWPPVRGRTVWSAVCT